MTLGHAPISKAARRTITAGLLLGMSLGALEATVIGTAMPTVVATLGGLAHYGWVFSAYLLTSTASVPIWGRLSDLYGRRRMYLIGVGVFLVGSAACGGAQSMTTLIAARALQGLGAGAVIPLSMTIVGELYAIEERARIQALFSGVWGVASVAGPLVGGYITDALSWRWVFLVNLPFGMLAVAVIALAYPPSTQRAPATVDWSGALLMFTGISALLIALGGEAGQQIWWLLAAVTLLTLFVVVERRAPEPILPIGMLRNAVVARTLIVVFLLGTSMFGAIAFIPLWVQAVIGGSATEAGQVLTPLFMGWVITSVVGARLTVQLGYRRVARGGVFLLAAGFVALASLSEASGRLWLLVACFVLGAGMGFSMLSLLLAVQHGVARQQLGIATSLNQFARSVGAAFGTAAMGALMARRLASVGFAADPAMMTAAALTPAVRSQFAAGLHDVFVSGAFAAGCALVASVFLPRIHLGGRVPANSGERMIAAEMTTLETGTEPSSVE